MLKTNEIYKKHPITPCFALNNPFPMIDDDDDELVTQYIWIIVDKSGSMIVYEEEVYKQILSTLAAFAESNKNSIDGRVRIKLVFFDNMVEEFNSVHLDPQDIADNLIPENYACAGSTNEGNLLKYIDSELSRSAPNSVVHKLRKNSPGFTFLIITDGKSNDNASLREEARRYLASNHFYKEYTRVLVAYIGDDVKHRSTAVALANGNENNVVALDSNLVSRLDRFILPATVIMPDGTHICDDSGASNQELHSVTDNIIERDKQGKESVEQLSSQEIDDILIRLMGK